MKKLKNILSGIKNFFSKVHSKLPKIPPMKPETREKLDKVINFMNRFSIIFHIILACFLTFIIEFISRRDLHSTLTFMYTFSAEEPLPASSSAVCGCSLESSTDVS